MGIEKHLPHAPITEAIIDIQVKPQNGVDYKKVNKAFETPDFGYYIKSPISEGALAFGMTFDGKPLASSMNTKVVGLRLHSSDEKYVLQVRSNRFTLSRLEPYENWDTLVNEARRLWNIYIARLAPEKTVRIATRFINNLHLPLHHGDYFQQYINKLIDVPDNVPQAVEAFIQKFRLVDSTTGGHVVLTLALNGIDPRGNAPVILDIDTFKLSGIDPDESAIWDELSSLRKLKNDCFFSILTDKALELYL